MGFFQELFGKTSISIKDLKENLKNIEQQRVKINSTLKKITRKHDRLIEKIKKARQVGNDLEVDYRWEDLKLIKVDGVYNKRKLRILNLEGLTLKKYIRGFEYIEEKGIREERQKLIQKIKCSGLDAKLEVQNINEQDYLDELDAIFNDAGIHDAVFSSPEDDPEKLHFLDKLDAIISAEESGNSNKAEVMKKELRKNFDELPELKE